ncbi:MAG: hypothetical protein ACFFC9_06315 [Promethearchaeota archaeon]
MSLAKEFGEIKFGEINNNAINEYTDSFDNYFNSEDLNKKNDILKEFGMFKFGEINNLLLIDFERALNRFFYVI